MTNVKRWINLINHIVILCQLKIPLQNNLNSITLYIYTEYLIEYSKQSRLEIQIFS